MDLRADVDSSKELQKDDKLGFRGAEDDWVVEGAILALNILRISWVKRELGFSFLFVSLG